MSKTQCSKKNYQAPDEPKYICKKCERLAKKEDKLCKAKKLKKAKS